MARSRLRAISGRVVARSLFALLLAGVGWPAGARALTVLYQNTWTGGELLFDTNTVFPSRTVSLGAGSLDVTTGQNPDEIFLDMSVPLAGGIPTTGTTFVDVTVRASRPSGAILDNDLSVGISDGSDVIAFMRADNAGGSAGALEGSRGVTQVLNRDLTLLTGTPGTFPDQFGAVFTVGATSSVEGFFAGSSVLNHAATRVIDRGSPLRVVLIANDPEEEYRISELSVTVWHEAAVPEPRALALAAVAGVLAALGRRRRG